MAGGGFGVLVEENSSSSDSCANKTQAPSERDIKELLDKKILTSDWPGRGRQTGSRGGGPGKRVWCDSG